MHAIVREPLKLNGREVAIVSELLEGERQKLLGVIRHTGARAPRVELRRRLETVDRLMERCHAAVSAE